jgi:hypothetical protein
MDGLQQGGASIFLIPLLTGQAPSATDSRLAERTPLRMDGFSCELDGQ